MALVLKCLTENACPYIFMAMLGLMGFLPGSCEIFTGLGVRIPGLSSPACIWPSLSSSLVIWDITGVFFSAPDSGEVTLHRDRQTGSLLRIQTHLRWGSMCDLQGQAPQRKIICLWFMSQALCTLLLSFFRAASNREDISGLARSGRKLWSVEEPDGSKQHSQGIHCPAQGSELSWC